MQMRTLSWVVLWAALASVVAAACGDDSEGDAPDGAPPDARIPMPVDGGPDADLRDAAEPPRDDAGMLAFGPGLVLDKVALADQGHAWAPYAPLVNVQFDQAINDGTMLILLELRGLADPGGQNDPDVDLALYSGIDLDGNASDNFSGMEPLQVAMESLDATGNPRALLPGAQLAGGGLQGTDPGPLPMYFPGLGNLNVYDAQFSGTLFAGGGGSTVASLGNGTLSGVLLARDLGAIPNPVPTMCLGETLLDVIAIGCLSIQGIQPDVDRDADGLEAFSEVAGMVDWVVDRCTDGDGATYMSVPGVPCVLDPAFQDGYTFTIQVTGKRAILLAP